MYSINIETGLIDDVEYHASPNFNERPDPADINAIIIHGISLPPGEFGGPWIEALFQNRIQGDEHAYFERLKGMQVSSHLVIRRDGQIIQYVPLNKRAWHAGVSSLHGRENCNDFSIGIELEGTDTIPYEAAQYDSLAAVVRSMLKHYPAIKKESIVGHCDIAPGRKTDPGQVFEWERFFAEINL